MKKAKTRKNIFSILSAILGVVFAFITGVTYCVTSLNLEYGTSPKSTTAYLANQQYHIVNDTINNPILFGEGSHNFEIALQYAIDYNFDVRFKYEMKWSDNTTAKNVIVNFANRDNIIEDGQYIYLADAVAAGSGKITFITGVDFVDTQDEAYFGKTLKINITEVKIYKQVASYGPSHYLYADASTSVAAQAWLYYKNKATSNNAYVMMYNYRRNYENGVPYPGLNSAYKKSANSSNKVTGSAWLGGNLAYAGTNMYVIAGTEPIKLEVQVTGVWRSLNSDDESSGDEGSEDDESDGAEASAASNDEKQTLISENSIEYNYTENWEHSSWDAVKLWETRKLTLVIPANTGCYIEVLESIEITSASRLATNLYDSYRAVINSIIINPTLMDNSVTPAVSRATTFEYTETAGDAVELAQIYSNSNLTDVTKTYVKSDVSVVNSSVYSAGLYLAQVGAEDEQTFNTNVSLINNTNTTKTLSVQYELYYLISNGKTNFTDEITNDDETKTYLRAEDYVGTTYTETTTDEEGNEQTVEKTYTKEDVFKGSLYYGYTVKTEQLSSTLASGVTIAPYSSVNLVDNYKVAADLQDEIATKFDLANDELTDYYDVWTFLKVKTTTIDTASTSNLTVESTEKDGTITVSVKNNTQQTITGLTISNFSVQELNNATYKALSSQPSDWVASYWKYYELVNGEYVALTSDPITANNPFVSNTYYEKSQAYEVLTTSLAAGFTASGTIITNSTVSLQPGDSVVFATATAKTSKPHIVVLGTASTASLSAPNSLMLVDNGKPTAYLINYSTSTSYYVRFSGTYTADTLNDNIDVVDQDYNYYIGIMRPGQIISVPMSSIGVLDVVAASGDYSAKTLTDEGWAETVVVKFTNLFS